MNPEPMISIAAATRTGELILRHPELSAVCVVAAKSTAIVVVAWLASLAFRRRSAVVRCWILRLVFPALLLAALWPLADRWLPGASVRFEVPASASVAAATAPVPAEPSRSEADDRPDEPTASNGDLLSPQDLPEAPGNPGVNSGVSPVSVRHRLGMVAVGFPVAWSAVAALLGLWMALRNFSGIWWLGHRSRVADQRMNALAGGLADELQMRRPLLGMVPGLASPLLTGWFRPRLWLPENTQAMPEERIRAILLHEMAHHRRKDLWWQAMASLTCAVWWWNPLVWITRRRLRHEAELAADEFVVAGNHPAVDYAEVLVHVAAGWTAGDLRKSRRAGVAMVGVSPIEKRVRAILADNPFRNRMGPKGACAASFIALLSIVIASFQAIAQRPGEVAGNEETFLRPEQAALVGKLKGILEERQARTRFVYFQTSSVWTRKMEDGSTITNSSIPSKAEVWLEMAANRFRIDYKPQVTPWIDGAAPFFVQNSSAVSDGRTVGSIDPFSGDTPREMPARESPETLSLRLEGKALDLLRRLSVQRRTVNLRLAVEEKKAHGRRVVELTEEFLDLQKQVTQRQTYQLDAADPRVLVFHRLEFPGDPEPRTVMEWRLLEAAEEPSVLRGRVVREDGTPCADLDVAVTDWRKTRSLKFRTRTDADGRFVWNGAPPDEVTVTFGWGQDRKGEFLSGYAITAKADEQTIVMKPAMRLRATVLDDATGEPVGKFNFTTGYPLGENDISWEKNGAKTITNGRIEWSSNHFRERCFLVEAEGYEPFQTGSIAPEQQTVTEVWRMRKK
jgi:beta-lactamase regulating signal transducer with metallopeptidase domain